MKEDLLAEFQRNKQFRETARKETLNSGSFMKKPNGLAILPDFSALGKTFGDRGNQRVEDTLRGVPEKRVG